MATNNNGKPAKILLVEDNPADVRLTVEALREAKVYNELNVVMDGEAAVAYLRREGKYTQAERPDIILLDLKLPKKDGAEVLADIKTDPNLRRIPVVVLTSSKAETDIMKVYDLQANCYVTKPVELQQFLDVVKAVEDFWLTVARLPPE